MGPSRGQKSVRYHTQFGVESKTEHLLVMGFLRRTRSAELRAKYFDLDRPQAQRRKGGAAINLRLVFANGTL